MDWLTRFVVAVAFLAAGVIFSPGTFGSLSNGENPAKLLIFLKLAHLLSFATAWGAALWATFIGGIIMFKNLPRHQFGNLQSKMFPAYFTLVGSCCAISLSAFGYLHPWKSSSAVEKYQLGFLLSAFAFVFEVCFSYPLLLSLKCVSHDRVGIKHLYRAFRNFPQCYTSESDVGVKTQAPALFSYLEDCPFIELGSVEKDGNRNVVLKLITEKPKSNLSQKTKGKKK